MPKSITLNIGVGNVGGGGNRYHVETNPKGSRKCKTLGAVDI